MFKPIAILAVLVVGLAAANAQLSPGVAAKVKATIADSAGEDITAASQDAITIRPTQPIVVNPAPVQVVIQDAGKTIDITSWAGYHSGDQIRIAVRHIIYVRPHTATDVNGVTHNGSALAVWPEGLWYTQEAPASLTARLAAVGWGDAASALQAADAGKDVNK